MLLHQAGLIDHAMRKSKQADNNPCYIGTKYQHRLRQNAKDESITFKLADFGGAFFILGFGFGIAVLILICEVLLLKRKVGLCRSCRR